MYPYELFFGLTLYEVLVAAGFLAAVLLFRRFSFRAGISAKLYNLALAAMTAAAVGGYLSGFLFQGVYDWLGGRPFSLTETTGSTFLGGFLGGFVILMAVYFGAGRILFGRRGEHTARFSDVADGYFIALTAGHGFGRIGCLMAGCCHGIASEHGIYFPELGYRALPTQLYEALFLFALTAVLWAAVKRLPGIGGSVYCLGYGIWRFFIEFIRGDDRGKTLVDSLSPSQLVSLLLAAAGVVLLILYCRRRREGDHEPA